MLNQMIVHSGMLGHVMCLLAHLLAVSYGPGAIPAQLHTVEERAHESAMSVSTSSLPCTVPPLQRGNGYCTICRGSMATTAPTGLGFPHCEDLHSSGLNHFGFEAPIQAVERQLTESRQYIEDPAAATRDLHKARVCCGLVSLPLPAPTHDGMMMLLDAAQALGVPRHAAARGARRRRGVAGTVARLRRVGAVQAMPLLTSMARCARPRAGACRIRAGW
jgi:hypothetical protein